MDGFDLSNVSYQDAVTKLAEWATIKRAGIGDGVGRLGEMISANPGTAATIGGGVLGGLVGGATEGADGWRGRVRRSLTGALSGAGIGGGLALTGKALFGSGPAVGGGGPKFQANGQTMQFDPKAVANDPNLASELASINDPTAYETASKGIKGIVGTGMEYAPFTTAGALPLMAAQRVYGRATTVSPSNATNVADLQGSRAAWGDRLAEALAERAKKAPKGGVTPTTITPGIRENAVNAMIDRALKSGEKDVSIRKTPFVGKQHLSTVGRTRFNRGIGLAALPAMDLLRMVWKGNADDAEKKQKLLGLVRSHAKPVQG
jgi:cytochrome c5